MIHVLGDEDEKEESKLSRHNYSKYSNNNHKKSAEMKEPVKEVTPEPVVQEPVIDIAPEPVAQETVAEQMRFIPVEGTVVDCAKLNVRVKPIPGASVVCMIEVNTKVEIDMEKSTNDWFYIRTAAGVEGYCMRKYIKSDL